MVLRNNGSLYLFSCSSSQCDRDSLNHLSAYPSTPKGVQLWIFFVEFSTALWHYSRKALYEWMGFNRLLVLGFLKFSFKIYNIVNLRIYSYFFSGTTNNLRRNYYGVNYHINNCKLEPPTYCTFCVFEKVRPCGKRSSLNI